MLKIRINKTDLSKMPVKTIEYGPVTEWRWGTDNPLMQEPYWTSVFLLDGLLIDSGAPDGVNALRTFILSLPPDKKVYQCFLTHGHEDHAGGANLLTNEFKIPVFATERTAKYIASGYEYADYRQVAWGKAMLPTHVEIYTKKSIITQSDQFELDLIPMPGHAPCLTALLDRTHQYAFVADAVLPKYKMLFGGSCNIREDIQQIYLSIQLLYTESEGMNTLKIFIAGHGVKEGRSFLKEKIEEIEDLHKKAHDLKAQGLEPKKILKKMFDGGESFIATFTRGELSRLNLLNSLLLWPLS